MAIFLGLHNLPEEANDGMVEANWSAYKAACAKKGLSAEHVHYNATFGKAYCVTIAESVDQVQEAHDEAGVPVDQIIEVKDLS